jgi:RHS repeat-associated protein
MHLLLKQTGRWFILLLLLAIAGSSRAQSVIILKKVLDGNAGQLKTDSTVTVKDSLYFDVVQLPKLDTPYSVKNIVTFRINEYSQIVLPTEFTASLNVLIIYTKPNLTVDSITKTLSLNYKATGTYSSRNSFVFNNAHQVKIKVLSVTITSASNILPALVLENEMDVTPVYKLSCTDDAVKTITAITPADTADEIAVNWPATTGADDYDLEWAYIDSSAIINNKYGNPVSAALIFRDNASRVTVADNSYKIPLIYDNGGILFYRVRAVQEKAKNVRTETSWSSDFTGGLGRFSYKGHERLLNWQSTISFAEDGKRKVVVQYYDGSLRSRQTVTKDNSTNTDVVAESFYDYQGRPVVQVLPAPTLNTAIRYFSNFNARLDGKEYDKSNYDSLSSPAAFLTASANPMSTASGANQYYSPQNPQKDNGLNRFIPDAGGYAFTETSYTQDNTGRISRQGGVGAVYRLGSNHETKYGYGSPGENDLDILFGTDVGDYKHYFKNSVEDANGQTAVTYMDMHGRTIATALSGTPDSASLANLSYNNAITYVDTLSRATSNVLKDLTLESTQSQLVTIGANYTFKYALTTPVLQLNDCTPTPVKYNVWYDVEIKITDDANNQRLGGKAFDTILRNYTPGTNPVANGTLQNINASFTVNLPQGNYEISKRLTVSKEAMAYYRDSIFAKRNFCTTFTQFMNQQRQLLLNTTCVPDCQSCRTSVGTLDSFRVHYITATGITDPDNSEVATAYANAVAACDDLCGTTSQVNDIRNAMLLDVSPPSGQYAKDTVSSYSIFYILNDRTLPDYKQASIIYLDEAGRPDTVYDESTNTYVLPQALTQDQFTAKFKASWAPALLPYHPEYCQYLIFQQYKDSYAWDRDFELTDTYDSAVVKGYLNPTGRTDIGITSVSAYLDPVVLQNSARGPLNRRLNNILVATIPANVISVWSMATTTVKCPTANSTCQALYNTPAKAFASSLCTADKDMAWRSFRSLYLNAKHDVLDSIINNAGCPVSAAQLFPTYQPNFNTASAALTQNGLGYLSNSSAAGIAASKDSVKKAMLASYANNCESYVNAWISQLAPCKYDTNDIKNILIPKLKIVCKEGADSSHPYGSSSVSPVSTYAYKTFQQVLDEYNAAHAIQNPWDCNAYLVTAPAPYDKQPAYYNKPVYSVPEPCECAKLNKLKGEYLANKTTADNTFAAYLTRTRGITMSDSDLTTLLSACNTTSSCTYLVNPISLPPALQCNSGEICVTCATVDSLYNKFVTKYSFTPTVAEAENDTIQPKKNQLFANYMNNQLGFSKQAWEYLNFRTQCQNNSIQARVASSAYTCTQLTTIKQQFQSSYPTGTCEQFVAYVNTQLSLNYNSTQINSMYRSSCGTSSGICDTLSYPVYDGMLLCGKSNPIFSTIKDSINNCSDSAYIIFNKATDLFNAYRDSLKGRFEQVYIDTSLAGGQRELFTMSYSTSEYHYTLYYYDQAGNLVKTVPPAGVVVNRSAAWCAGVRASRAAGLTNNVPPHKLVTEYRYNTLNQVISQKTPDGSIANFWYDRLGRLAISQNKKQFMLNAYSYTTYDPLGRILEVGEITSSTAMSNATCRDTTLLATWLNNATATRTQITRTSYDIANSVFGGLLTPVNLRNRVSWSALYNSAAEQTSGFYAAGTFYSYDIHGNVDTLVQDYKQAGGAMLENGNRWKKIVYNYDLISGKVNRVAYQPGQQDAFYHRYSYDAENRITNVETSHDSIYWENDAFYQYYKHGPLARSVIGQQQVQGIDYAYTLQGWLKGVNSTAMTPAYDMGGDGATSSISAKDVFGFALHYFGNRDYSPVSTTVKPFAAAANLSPLFNGNIAAISQHLPSLGVPLQYNYSYDVLNRLVGMQASQGLNTSTNAWTPVVLNDFKEAVSYDPNGNILNYIRNGNNTFAGKPLAMDKLAYTYKTGSNRLDFVYDSVSATYYGNDLDAQSAGNYVYDSIGNITRDIQAGIDSITWTVYGKIRRIKKSNGIAIDYTYDVAGNRISKTTNGIQTWYVRDATGNVMGIYTKGDSSVNNGVLSQTETHLYGSSRLGINTLTINVAIPDATPITPLSGLGSGININFIRGKKFFELSNHLGNVLATVSDKKVGISVNGTSIDHYEADLTSAQEYYPFGMLMPGRSGHTTQGGYSNGSSVVNGYTVASTLSVNNREGSQPNEYAASETIEFLPGFESASGDAFTALIADGTYTGAGNTGGGSSSVAMSGYRYGFNGKEYDNEVKGEGNSIDFGARAYDSRVGLWLSVDPLQAKYPNITPYHFAAGNPVNFIDVDGKDIIHFMKTTTHFPRRQVSDGFYIGGISSISNRIAHIKAPGKDVFFYDVVQKSFSAHDGLSVVYSKSTQFYPNDPHSAVGITQSASNNVPFTNVNNFDFISLAKLAPEGLVDELIKKDPGMYSNLRIARTGMQLEEGMKDVANAGLMIDGAISILGAAKTATYNPALLTEDEMGSFRQWYRYDGEEVGFSEPYKHGWRIEINLPEKYQGLGIGSEIFKREVANSFRSDFHAMWVKSSIYTTGISDNLKTFNKWVAKGLTNNEAAWKTWTGIQAQKAGYNSVKVSVLENGNVNATFSVK